MKSKILTLEVDTDKFYYPEYVYRKAVIKDVPIPSLYDYINKSLEQIEKEIINETIEIKPHYNKFLLKDPKDCNHNWIDAKNEVISSGYWCPKCNSISKDNDCEKCPKCQMKSYNSVFDHCSLCDYSSPDFIICEHCGDDQIEVWFKYCPMCGHKIKVKK